MKSQLPTVEMAIEVEVDYLARASVAHDVCAAHVAHVAGGIGAEVEIPLYLIAQILRSRVCRSFWGQETSINLIWNLRARLDVLWDWNRRWRRARY